MSEQGSGIGGRKGPIAWGGLALLFLGALLGSMFLANAAVAASERDAIDRAEDVTASIVASELTPELVLRDISGEDYRTLIVAVQAGILSDDQVVTVRVWRTDGDLIFSTAQRDEPAEVLALDDPQIQAAAAGEVVSVLSTEIEPRVGLHRVNEELFQTYVPVHLVSESFVEAVVEIDQRYGSITGEALVLWRPLQFLLAGLFVVAVSLAIRSMRRRVVAEAAPGGSQVAVAPRSDDRALKETRERLHAAERRAQEAEQRLKDGEQSSAPVPAPSSGRAHEELDLKLRAAEAEREQHTGEIQRLRAALAEKEADLALAREGGGNTRTEAKKATRLAADADRRAAEAEQKTAATERRAMEATQRAVDASGRSLEMEAQVRELEDKLAKAGAPAETPAPSKRRDGGERKAAAELKKTNDELTKSRAELQNAKAELQSAGAELVTTRSELGTAETELGTSRSQIEHVQAERDQLLAKTGDLEAALAEALDAIAAKDVPASELGEPDAQLAEALAKLRDLEDARSSLVAELEEAKASPGAEHQASGDAEGRIAELERARRADIAELQKAQESFANTQVELANSTRSLREAERKIRELEQDLGRPSRGVPTYVPNGDDARSPTRAEPSVVAADPVVTAAGQQADVAPAESDLDATIDLQSFEHRVSSLRAGLESANDTSGDLRPLPEADPLEPPPDPEPRPEPEPTERERERALDPDEDGLSLRERLARAAAARHRGPLS